MAEECNKKLMCDYNLNNRDDMQAWIKRNHPDRILTVKGNQSDSAAFTEVMNCYKIREYCDEPAASSSSPNSAASSRMQESSPEEDSEGVVGAKPLKGVVGAKPLKGVVGAKPLNLKKRQKIFTCMRQTENWSKILPQHKMDSKSFDPEKVKAAIHNASPKLEQLFQIIQQVDANDLQMHGHYFKHFIFSDVKEEGYGAKILASAFMAEGYKNLITARAVPGQKALRLTLLPTGADGQNKAFGLLSSSAIFKSEFNQKFKKEILTMYNKRPDNIHGENMRFIILDSGFKEGIDLFDVKYVHIFEPSMTVADLKQTVGRATRTCGQKGLNFEPNVGWPLFVYNYYIAVPEAMKDIYQAADPSLLRYPDEDTMLFKNATKLKEATVLYSEYDKTLTNLSEQLYKLAPVFSVDFELTKNIHRIDDMSYLYEQQKAASQDADPLSGGSIKDNMNCKGKCGLRSTKAIPATVDFLYKVYVKYGHNRKNIPSKGPRAYFCAYMKTHPDYCTQVNKEWANRAAFVPYLLDKSLQKQKQQAPKKRTIKIKKNTGTYMAVQDRTPTPYMAPVQKSASYMDINANKSASYMDLNANKSATPYLEIGTASAKQGTASAKQGTASAKHGTYMTPEQKSASYMDLNANSATPYMEIGTAKSTRRSQSSTRRSQSSTRSKSSLKIANEIMQKLDLVPHIPPTAEIDYSIVEYTGKTDSKMQQEPPGPPTKKLTFTQMRDFIKTNYVKNFTWGPIVVENKCVQPQAQQPQAQQPQAQQPQAQAQQPAQTSVAQAQMGGASRIMSLNPTQDFVRTFFTPQSAYKGLLLFHSVGTGKTCSAIATATSSYEQAGYTILWVTRTTLKSDVYKNMFDDVCHLILAERMQQQGLVIPEDPAKRKRLLSKNWIEPISYKTFSNLLTPGAHNEYMDKLIQRNGTADILKKTLIIIDEAHKLYGGDLKGAERPNMAVLERLLQKSYDVSGKDSARLLIMTATPFTNSPMELFQLVNLCKESANEKITTDLREFKRKYMNADALLTDVGVKKLADKLSGYISYLNREQDPTQFAQPIMIDVPVLMSHIEDPEMRRDLLSADQKGVNTLNKIEAKALSKQEENNIKDLNKRLRETQKRLKDILKERQAKCKTLKTKVEKAHCMAESKAEVETEVKSIVENIKVELERLKKSQSENKGLKQAEKDRIGQMKERLETLRNDLLQEVMLVKRCKNITLA